MTTRHETISVASAGAGEDTGGAALPLLAWPGFAFDRSRVRDLGVPAYCWTPDGEFWEFEDGEFYLIERGGRRRADDEHAPLDGWSHPEECVCPACRVAPH